MTQGAIEREVVGRRVYVTGAAGFIGFHVARALLDRGALVRGYDCYSDYYDVKLKNSRVEILSRNRNFGITRGLLEDYSALRRDWADFKPEIVFHLAGQAGVRYSFENPQSYIQSNIVGSFNVLTCAQELGVRHLLLASTSSVYGLNTEVPFRESHGTDRPVSFYAATKKSMEVMAYSISKLSRVPTTVMRLFTVYGPWGRPDMAIFKFTESILNGRPIEIYNRGRLWRDFTFIDDVVQAMILLIDRVPGMCKPGESTNPLVTFEAPYQIVNVGNSEKVLLLDFVDAIEGAIGTARANRVLVEMQPGDVMETWADTSVLSGLTNFRPSTAVKYGVEQFVSWYRSYYKV